MKREGDYHRPHLTAEKVHPWALRATPTSKRPGTAGEVLSLSCGRETAEEAVPRRSGDCHRSGGVENL